MRIAACLTYGPDQRSPEHTVELVEQFRGALAKEWAPHDVTGDGEPETWCNKFAEAFCQAAQVYLPKVLLANAQVEWLGDSTARSLGWFECDRTTARRHAEAGLVVLIGWVNPKGRHGHIAVGMPPPAGDTTERFFVAQAGARCFIQEPLERGFGAATPQCRFFVHP